MINRKIKIGFSILFLLAAIIFANKFLFSWIKDVTFSVVAPFENVFWRTVRSLPRASIRIFRPNFFEEENNRLKKENLSLKAQLIGLENLKKENEELRRVLNLGLTKKHHLIEAEIISPEIEKDAFLLNRGEKDGIKTGMPVINSENVLFGRIGRVSKNFSQLILLSANDFVFPVKIKKLQRDESKNVPKNSETKKEIPALCRGKGRFQLELELIKKENKPPEGSLVFTSSLGGIFPGGLLVGEIKNIQAEGSTLFLRGAVIPYFQQVESENVFIISNFNN